MLHLATTGRPSEAACPRRPTTTPARLGRRQKITFGLSALCLSSILLLDGFAFPSLWTVARGKLSDPLVLARNEPEEGLLPPSTEEWLAARKEAKAALRAELEEALDDEFVGPTEEELQRWWAQQLLKREVDINHVEDKFFPVNLSSPDLDADLPIGVAYTRAWRRDSILRVLSAWTAVCTTLNLTYWLDAGSLLGRARSAGKSLIPWDFDADVGMVRSEFLKLNSSLNQGGRAGLTRDFDFGLTKGIIVVTRQSISADALDIASRRDDVIPGRIIDTTSGLYVDIFVYTARKDGGVQLFWPYRGPSHTCGEGRRLAAGAEEEAGETQEEEQEDEDGEEEESEESVDITCDTPCPGYNRCYAWPAGVVIPSVPCKLEGVQGYLQCPQSEAQYLEELYGGSWRQPDRTWDSDRQDFIA